MADLIDQLAEAEGDDGQKPQPTARERDLLDQLRALGERHRVDLDRIAAATNLAPGLPVEHIIVMVEQVRTWLDHEAETSQRLRVERDQVEARILEARRIALAGALETTHAEDWDDLIGRARMLLAECRRAWASNRELREAAAAGQDGSAELADLVLGDRRGELAPRAEP